MYLYAKHTSIYKANMEKLIYILQFFKKWILIWFCMSFFLFFLKSCFILCLEYNLHIK